MKQFALVTGASQGLGKYLALELARRKMNTVLISLPGENLNQVSDKCKELGVESHYFETDLTRKKNIVQLADWINANFNISILINNAGIGGTKRFSDCSPDYINSMIQLNVRAITLLIYFILPNLTKNKTSYILNVSSIASFCPIGYKAVYCSSKRYIQNFSMALREEIGYQGVNLSILFPGPMLTNESVTERIGSHGALSNLLLMKPELIASYALRKMYQKKSRIIPGLTFRIAYSISSMFPERFLIPVFTRIFRKEAENNNDTKSFSMNYKIKRKAVNIHN